MAGCDVTSGPREPIWWIKAYGVGEHIFSKCKDPRCRKEYDDPDYEVVRVSPEQFDEWERIGKSGIIFDVSQGFAIVASVFVGLVIPLFMGLSFYPDYPTVITTTCLALSAVLLLFTVYPMRRNNRTVLAERERKRVEFLGRLLTLGNLNTNNVGTPDYWGSKKITHMLVPNEVMNEIAYNKFFDE